jgi:pyruvate dehydrogenase E2 component (dihydrolipoamide acetyltransferase)
MFDVILPLMGEGVNEATLVRWIKTVGETVEKDEPLFEVSTDKVDTEIPSPTAGLIKELLVSEGQVVEVNHIVARIESSEGDSLNMSSVVQPKSSVAPQSESALSNHTAPSSVKHSSKPLSPLERGASTRESASVVLSKPPTETKHLDHKITNRRASPLVRKLAAEKGVDLSLIGGTGVNGRITRRDFEEYLRSPPRVVSTPSDQEQAVPRLQTKTVDGVELLDGVAVKRQKMSRIRKLTADHMVKSVSTSPHASIVFEVDLHKVTAKRLANKKAFEVKYGFGLTFTAYFIHAASLAIQKHPIVNVSVDGDEILHKNDVNIGCAVAVPSGLIVPVIKKSQELSLVGVAQRLNDVVTRARQKQLQAEDIVGGTFTISNFGGWGGITAMPIINQPQVAILGIGAIVKKAVVVDDNIAIRPQVLLSLTFDHRVIDGEGAANYLATMKDLLESDDFGVI